jgi:hypothetical protein
MVEYNAKTDFVRALKDNDLINKLNSPEELKVRIALKFINI